MATAESQDISIMVIGAGSGGRLIAQGLRKVGIPCTVFEQDLSLDQRHRDWDFGIYWAQTPLDECLPKDIQDKLITTQVDRVQPHADAFLPGYNGETGELIQTIPSPYYLRLRRRELSRMMEKGLDICYGKRLVSLDATSGPGVTAIFEDGTRHTASLLIGAEGAHSNVRKYLLGEEKGQVKLSPIVLSCIISKLPVEIVKEFQQVHKRSCLLFHPNGTFFWLGVHNAYDNPDDMAEWEFTFMVSWPQTEPFAGFPDSKSIIADLKERAKPLAQPFRRIIQAVDDNVKAWANFLPYWPTEGWAGHPARGKVTLAGDAAHPMTPHRGQGLNNAILDCRDFVKEVEAMGVDRTVEKLREAVTRYEEKMWERGYDAVTSSLENSIMVHDWGMLMQSPIMREGVTKQKVEMMEAEAQAKAKANGNGKMKGNGTNGKAGEEETNI